MGLEVEKPDWINEDELKRVIQYKSSDNIHFLDDSLKYFSDDNGAILVRADVLKFIFIEHSEVSYYISNDELKEIFKSEFTISERNKKINQIMIIEKPSWIDERVLKNFIISECEHYDGIIINSIEYSEIGTDIFANASIEYNWHGSQSNGYYIADSQLRDLFKENIRDQKIDILCN